jgi:antitoxin FitA
MPNFLIRDLDEAVKSRLRVRAARHGRSMSEEVRVILREAVTSESAVRPNLADSIRSRIEPIGGVHLKLPRREKIRKPPVLDQ